MVANPSLKKGNSTEVRHLVATTTHKFEPKCKLKQIVKKWQTKKRPKHASSAPRRIKTNLISQPAASNKPDHFSILKLKLKRILKTENSAHTAAQM